MKKLYSLIVACLLAGGAFAQTSTSGTTKSGIKYGIKAGVNFAKVGFSGDDVDDEEKDAVKSQTSFLIGGLVDIPVSSSFSIQPGLTLSGKGFKEEYEGEDDKEENNVMYLEIPVNAVYKIGGIYLGAGPYAAFAISGKNKDGDDETDLEFGNDPEKDNLKRGDFGLNLLGGYQLTNGLNFGINYGLGLNNILPDYEGIDYKAKNRVFSVTVGFTF